MLRSPKGDLWKTTVLLYRFSPRKSRDVPKKIMLNGDLSSLYFPITCPKTFPLFVPSSVQMTGLEKSREE